MEKRKGRHSIALWVRLGLAAASALVAVLLLPAHLGVKVDASLRSINQPQNDGTPASSAPIKPASISVVNFAELAAKESRSSKASQSSAAPKTRAIPPPKELPELQDIGVSPTAHQAAARDQISQLGSSPGPSQSFSAVEDGPQAGTGTFTTPPDTTGAVGPDKLFVTLNNNYRIQDKATGSSLSTVSIDSFWSSTGASDAFDPRVQFDPFNNRWIVVATSNGDTGSSSILVGVSATSDPQGVFTLFRFVVGCAAGAANCSEFGETADFPMLGFNKNWIAVSWNQFELGGPGEFFAGKVMAIDYPSLRNGTSNSTVFTVSIDSNPAAFCMHPATTLSPTEDTLYFPAHISSAAATYRLHKLTGTPTAPVYLLDTVSKTRPGGGWTQPGGEILPQDCVGAAGSTCPAKLRAIESSDAFIRSNVVFRDGKIWYAQTIALPMGGLGQANTHTASQWTSVDTSGNFADGGRVEDATATSTGGEWYGYSSIAVNNNDDVLLGFSNFSADHLARAGYALRLGVDSPGTMRDPVIFKDGEDYYSKDFGDGRNRWGDYSHSVVDPANDFDFWTIQEYAATRTLKDSLQSANNSHWGTWWAKVEPNGAPASPTPTPTPCATTFIINDNGNADDTWPGDRVCVTAGGTCTLRAAIQEANARPTCGAINFDLSGVTSPISLPIALPDINHNININGPGANQLVVQRSSAGSTPDFRIFSILNNATVNIAGLTLTNGKLSFPGVGGAIVNSGTLTISECLITNNTSSDGGAIFNGSGGFGSLTLISSTISGNTSTGSGGGIESSGSPGSTFKILNSTISGNSATNSAGGLAVGSSGSTPAFIINSTISGNSAGSDAGGLLFTSSVGFALNVINTTVTLNRANSVGNNSSTGGGIKSNVGTFGPTLSLRNTIVAGNFKGTGTASDDISGTVVSSSSFNLIGAGGAGGLTDGTNGNQVGVSNPGLGALLNNGGPTMTHALLSGSAAIDRGSSALAQDQNGQALPNDQRGTGFPRIFGPAVDVGAFEIQMSVPTPTPTPTPSPTPYPLPTPQQLSNGIIRLPLAANDLIYDSKAGRIYASVPNSAGGFGNSLAPIEPATGTVSTPVTVGSEPRKLAISADNQFIYVGLDGIGAVRRFDLASQTAGLQFSLGTSGGLVPQNLNVDDMAVLPNDPNAVAISRRNFCCSPRYEGLAIYDNGVQRPNFVGGGFLTEVIEFSSSSSTLYGYDNESTGFQFRKMAVNASGVSVTSSTSNLIAGFGVDIKYDNGRIYASNGRVIDPEANTVLGTFQGVSSPAFVPDSAAGRVYFVTGSDGTTTLQAFDSNTFLPIGTMPIPGVNGAPASLIRWGANGLAFRTSGNQIYFIQPSLATPTPTPTPIPTPSPTPTATPTPTPTPSCNDDSWTATNTANAPAPRYSAATVWTGTEMIVWGGSVNNNTGARYNPATNAWTPMSTTNAPSARNFYSTIWTGTEMIVWGGSISSGETNTGARYNPSTDTWTPLSLTNVPLARSGHTAIWTGSEMIVWGGNNRGLPLNTGAKYNQANDTWTEISTANATARQSHSAVWTGTEMIVWGGSNSQLQKTGARYNPISDTWSQTSLVNAPAARSGHSAVWTGSEMIIWGGYAGMNSATDKTNTGGRYNPTTDSWTPTSLVNAPTPRGQHTTIWTGAEMIIWGGESQQSLENIGGRYNPATDSWISTCDQGAPVPRVFASAAWTGTAMIIWGGATYSFTALNTGGRYLLPQSGPPSVQLSSGSYSTEEGGSLTVTATRTGNTASASTVDYRTTDTDTFTVNCGFKQGQAYSRCDFATVVGTLSFAAGETSKTFSVPIINDGYAEGDETFTVVLSNPMGATLGAPSTATVTINDNEATDGANAILQTNGAGVDFFVRQHYLDFLGREPEQGEPWSAILNGCANQFNTDPNSPSAGCDRIIVSGSFFGSPEFSIKGLYVIDFYRVAFDRLPTYSEFVFDLASITGATAAEANAKRPAFANNFVLRSDFATLAGMTNSNYVTTLMSHNGQYNLTSITTPDPANPDGSTKVTLTTNDLINGLNGSTLTRAQVLRAIVQSDQVTQNLETVNAFVASQYYGYLRRTPDTAGFNNWVNYLKANPNDFRTMVNGFVNSNEYRLRFGPL